MFRRLNHFSALLMLLASALYSGLVSSQTTNIPQELIHYPDFVFFNGQVLTADSDVDFTITEAVAVRGNRIFKVGTDNEVRPLAGPDTRVVDLKGRSLTPGFIYNDADNAVPAGDLIKDSQWGGYMRPKLGGSTIDHALLTLGHIVENEGQPGEPMFFNLQDQWAAVAMR